jgi:hypothetical protein
MASWRTGQCARTRWPFLWCRALQRRRALRRCATTTDGTSQSRLLTSPPLTTPPPSIPRAAMVAMDGQRFRHPVSLPARARLRRGGRASSSTYAATRPYSFSSLILHADRTQLSPPPPHPPTHLQESGLLNPHLVQRAARRRHVRDVLVRGDHGGGRAPVPSRRGDVPAGARPWPAHKWVGAA